MVAKAEASGPESLAAWVRREPLSRSTTTDDAAQRTIDNLAAMGVKAFAAVGDIGVPEVAHKMITESRRKSGRSTSW